MQPIRMLLKEKYSLVHLPSGHKIDEWHRCVLKLLTEGQTKERAGMIAAKKVFPYEYREYRVYDGPEIESILALFE
jgi:hypothetical protein